MRRLYHLDRLAQTLIAHDFGCLGYLKAHKERLLVSQVLNLQARQYLTVLQRQAARRCPCLQ